MPTTVDIPELGTVEFPDSMSEQDISAEVGKLTSRRAAPSLSRYAPEEPRDGYMTEVARGLTQFVPALTKTTSTIGDKLGNLVRRGVGLEPLPLELPEARPLYKAGQWMQDKLDTAYPAVPEPRRNLGHDVASGLGQMASMVAGGVAARGAGATLKGAALVGAALGFGQEFDDAFTRARQRGDDPDTALWKSLGYASLAAMIENKLGAGRIIKKYFPDPAEAARKLSAWGISKATAISLAVGFGEEGSQRFAQNWIVEGKPSLEGVVKEGAPGGLVQAIAELPATLLRTQGGRVRRQPRIQTNEDTAVIQPRFTPQPESGLSRVAPVIEDAAAEAPPALDTQLILERLAKSAGGASIDDGKTFALSADYTWEGLAKDLGTGTRTAALLADAGIVERTPEGNYRLNHNLFRDDIESLRKRGFLPVLTPPNVTEVSNVKDRESSSMEVSAGQPAESVPPVAAGVAREIQKPAAVLAQAQPIEPEVARQKLWVNMQDGEMDIPLDKWQQPSHELKLMLGDNAPSWRDLNFSGVVTANKNPDGSYRVKVIPRTTEQTLAMKKGDAPAPDISPTPAPASDVAPKKSETTSNPEVISPYTEKPVTASDFPGAKDWEAHAGNIAPSVWSDAEGLKAYLADLEHDSKLGGDNSEDLVWIADVERRISEIARPIATDLFPDLKGKAPTLERVRNAIVEAEADLEAKFEAATDENIRSDNPIHAEVDLAQKRVDRLRALGRRLEQTAISKATPEANIAERAIASIEDLQKKLRGSGADVSMGVPKAILDLALEVARLSLKAGNTIYQAIDAAIAKIREQMADAEFDEAQVREAIRQEIEPPTGEARAREDEVRLASMEAEIASGAEPMEGEGRTISEMYGVKHGYRPALELGPEARFQSALAAQTMFMEAGLDVVQGAPRFKNSAGPDGYWRIKDAHTPNEQAGERLLEAFTKRIESLEQDRGEGIALGLMGNENTSIRNIVTNMNADEAAGLPAAFSPDLRSRLMAAAQGEARIRGQMLAALRGKPESLLDIAQNFDTHLRISRFNELGGESISPLMRKIWLALTAEFSPEQIADILKANPNLAGFGEEMARQAANENAGSRFYKRVQNLYNPKKPKTLKQLLSLAREDEKLKDIVAQLEKLYGVLPAKKNQKKLTPLEKLLHYVNPATAPKIEELTRRAVAEAEQNAGEDAIIAREQNLDVKKELREQADAGDLEVTPEDIEEGLELPRHRHWKLIRESVLGYSPTTLAAVQEMIASDFSKTRFKEPTAKAPDLKIDLGKLAVSPETEVQRVLDNYLAGVELAMDTEGATTETQLRVLEMAREQVAKQIERIRQERLDIYFDPVTRKVTTAEGKLAELLNLGVANDPRYKTSPKIAALIERITKKFTKPEAMDALALKSRPEKFAEIQRLVNEAVREGNLPILGASDFNEFYRAVAFSEIAERLFAAEERITRSVTDSPDVLFGKQPAKTAEELAQLRREQIQALNDAVNAGAADVLPSDTLARKRKVDQLAPKLSELAKQLTALPQEEHQAKAELFAESIMAELEVDPANVDKVRASLESAFTRRLETVKAAMRDKALAERITREGDAADKLDAIRKLANAGIFADPRLDSAEIAKRLTANAAVTKLLPKINDLVAKVFELPTSRQQDFADRFAADLARRLNLDAAQEERARKVFSDAFNQKFVEAKKRALARAIESLSPAERKLKEDRSLWQKIERFVNAGGFDTDGILKELALAKGWQLPTTEQIDRMREWARREQELRFLPQSKLDALAGQPEALAKAVRERFDATSDERSILKQRMQTLWSRMTLQVNLLKHWRDPAITYNNARAILEYSQADSLARATFAPRQWLDVASFGLLNVITRPYAHAAARVKAAAGSGEKLSTTVEYFKALGEAIETRWDFKGAGWRSAAESLKGRGLLKQYDLAISRIGFLDRLVQRSNEQWDKGNYAGWFAYQAIAIPRAGFKIVSAFDLVQSVPIELQELRHAFTTQIIENGGTRSQAKAAEDVFFANAGAELDSAFLTAKQIFEEAGIKKTKNALKNAALHIVRGRMYVRLALDAREGGTSEADIKLLMNTVSWNERLEGGLGSVFTKGGQAVQEVGARGGLPLPAANFGNAMGTALNRMLSVMGGAFFHPYLFKGDPFFRTEKDIAQRKAEAVFFMPFNVTLFYLAATGFIAVLSKWPEDKKEREEWQAKGWEPGTMLIPSGDGKVIPISTRTGPGFYVGPWVTAGGAINKTFDEWEKKNAALKLEAERKGLEFVPLPKPNATAVVAALWGALRQTMVGGRTASGALGTLTDYGNWDEKTLQRSIAANIAPIIPLAPAVGDALRLAGLNVDPKLASFTQMIVPVPGSGSLRINALGDPVGTMDDVQRVVSKITGGTVPWPTGGEYQSPDKLKAYQNYFNSDFSAPPINPGKNYQIDGNLRSLTPSELQRYTVARGRNFAAELAGVDVTGLPPKEAKAVVQGAFQRANAAALSEVGAVAPQAARASGGTAGAASFPAAAIVPRAPRRTGLARLAASRVGGRSRIARPRFASLRGLGRPTRRRRSIVGRLGRVRRPRGLSMRGLRRPRMPRPRRLRRRVTTFA